MPTSAATNGQPEDGDDEPDQRLPAPLRGQAGNEREQPDQDHEHAGDPSGDTYGFGEEVPDVGPGVGRTTTGRPDDEAALLEHREPVADAPSRAGGRASRAVTRSDPSNSDLEDGPRPTSTRLPVRERAETMSRVMAMSGADISTVSRTRRTKKSPMTLSTMVKRKSSKPEEEQAVAGLARALTAAARHLVGAGRERRHRRGDGESDVGGVRRVLGLAERAPGDEHDHGLADRTRCGEDDGGDDAGDGGREHDARHRGELARAHAVARLPQRVRNRRASRPRSPTRRAGSRGSRPRCRRRRG